MTRRLSIGGRLMLWYVAILSALLLVFALTIYLTMRSQLREQLDDTLENRAFFATELITTDGGELAINLDEDATNPDSDDTFHRLISSDGDVVFSDSRELGDVPLDDDAVRSALAGNVTRSTVSASGREVRVRTQPVREGGDIVGVLQVGQTTDDIDETLSSLLRIFAIALPSALVLASLGGWWLSSRALSPIDRVTNAAREISDGGDLSRRLNLDLPDDEVGRLARTFDEMLARLDEAFQRQRRFTADASHELRTPLTAVRGQIDVALERPRDPAEYQRVLAEVNAQVDRMTRLVGGLLMLARSDAGALPIERERVDIGGLMESVAEQIRAGAELKGLAVRVDADGVLQTTGDEDLLLQLMLNLADNAVKYTRSGVITLGWRSGGAPQAFVRDTGGGIAAEHRERIFERFYRVDSARSGEDSGAGLGLAISRWIAEAHGASLILESDDGGSTFTVRFGASG
jgi:heavy metal sensor kinase